MESGLIRFSTGGKDMNLNVLPENVQRAFSMLPEKQKQEAMELRFRIGRPVTVVYRYGEQVLAGSGAIPVTQRLLEELLNRATGYSPYSMKLEETGLYLPLKDGCRMGLCGEVVVKEGKLSGIRHLSSVSIRLAREHIGIAREVADMLCTGTAVASAIIVSPPGGGKTSFLRDLIRCISQKGFRVSVVDERRELGAMMEGRPMLDLGPTTDVLCGCPKIQAIELLVRAMNPQVLALDEISGEEELEAAMYAAFSGTALLATAHGDGISSLMRRPLYRNLLMSGAFDWCITLEAQGEPRMERLGAYAEVCRSDIRNGGLADGGLGCGTGVGAKTAAASAAAAFFGGDAGRAGTEYAAPVRAV